MRNLASAVFGTLELGNIVLHIKSLFAARAVEVALLKMTCPCPCFCRGTVLMAPMLSLEKVSRKGINPLIRPLATLLSWLVPTAAIVATERNVLYPDIQARK